VCATQQWLATVMIAIRSETANFGAAPAVLANRFSTLLITGDSPTDTLSKSLDSENGQVTCEKRKQQD
jgi:hypothetical protein